MTGGYQPRKDTEAQQYSNKRTLTIVDHDGVTKGCFLIDFIRDEDGSPCAILELPNGGLRVAYVLPTKLYYEEVHTGPVPPGPE